MRLTLPALLPLISAAMLTACGSSWGGDPLPTLGAVPQWPDCDLDGWGSAVDAEGVDQMVCYEVGSSVEGECPLVENDLDCDDTYAFSGGDYTRAGCPDQFDWYFGEIGPDDYLVQEVNGREYMAFLPTVPRAWAVDICESWALSTVANAVSDPGGMATLETTVALSEVETLLSDLGDLTLWVGARLDEDDTLVWDLQDADGAYLPVDPTALPLCDTTRPLTLEDVLPIPADAPDASLPLEQLREGMVLPVRFGGVRPCVMRPVENCPGFDTVGGVMPLAGDCQDFSVLCERPALQSYDYTPYRDAADQLCDAG